MPEVVYSWLGTFIGHLVLFFLGSILALLIKELLRLSRENESPAFESNWGGLGRGLGGWTVNRMMVFSLLTVLVFLMFCSVAYEIIPVKPGSQSGRDDHQQKDKDLGQTPPENKSAEPKQTEAKDAAPAPSSGTGAAAPSPPANAPSTSSAGDNKSEGAPK